MEPADEQSRRTTKFRESHILDDTPSDVDSFGSHQRVSDGISNFIQNETGSKAIALTGSYGSGKSTVVSLLRQKLTEAEKPDQLDTKVFVFDAWFHEGDPLRRSFLEELVDYLCSVNWTSHERWKDDLERLSNRREDTETTSTPILTRSGVAVALTFLAAPVGYALVRTMGGDLPRLFWNIPVWLVGLLLVFLPAIVALVVWVSQNLFPNSGSQRDNENPLGLFLNKTRQIVQSSATKTPEPTSLEFEAMFRKILRDTLAGHSRRLVVVMDNLDRLSSDREVMSTWATMRTFVDASKSKGVENDATSNFWLLVPFNSREIERVWGIRADSDDVTDERYADLFLTKTFDATFRVSPPILTSFQNFLYDNLASAFPEHERTEIRQVERVYRRYGGIPEDRPVTPRDIKSFINKLVALYKQWGDSIPLGLQALYVQKSKELQENFLGSFQYGNGIETSLTDDFTLEEQKRCLAAIHYGVEPEAASEAVIGPRAEQALANNDVETLKILNTMPDFSYVIGNIVEANHQRWSKENPLSVANAALAVRELQDASESWESTWHLLRFAAIEVAKSERLYRELGEGLQVLIEEAPESALVEFSRSLIVNIVKEEENEELADPDGPLWIEGVHPVLSAIEARGQTDLLKEHFDIPYGADFYLHVMEHLSEVESMGSLQRYLVPRIGFEEVRNRIISRLPGAAIGEDTADAVILVKELFRAEGIWLGREGLDAIIQVLTQYSDSATDQSVGLPPEKVIALVKLLLYIVCVERVPEAESAIGDLASGRLQQYLHAHKEAAEVVGMCSLPLLLFNVSGNSTQQGAQNSRQTQIQQGQTVFTSFVQNPASMSGAAQNAINYALELGVPTILLEQDARAADSNQLIKQIIREAATSDQPEHYFSPESLFAGHPRLVNALSEEDYERLIEHFMHDSGLLEEAATYDLSATRPEVHRVLVSLGPGYPGYASYVRSLITALEDLTQEQWESSLEQDDSIVDIVQILVSNDYELGLGTPLAAALRGHYEELHSQDEDSQQEWLPASHASWHKLPKALTADLEETFYRNLGDYFIANHESNLVSLIQLYGDPLTESPIIMEKPDDFVRKVLNRMVEFSMEPELEWTNKVLDRQPHLLQECPGASKEALRATTREKLNSDKQEPEDKQSQALKSIARHVRVKASPKKEQ